MLKIVLVRHGYSLGNKEQTLSGWKDVPLVKEGIEELNELKAAYHYPETESYFSSDLSRAYETAKILFPGREVLELAAFREMNFGIYEGKDEKQVDYHAFFGGWFAGAPIEGGENYFQFRNRVMKAIEALCWEMVESGKESTTLVSHSGVIRVLFSQCYKTGRDGFFEIPVPNGLGYILHANYEEGELKLLKMSGLRKKEKMLDESNQHYGERPFREEIL